MQGSPERQAPSAVERGGVSSLEIWFGGTVFVAGLALRLHLALTTWLNPDEALQGLLAEGSLPEALHKALSVTHPPLLLILTNFVLRFSRADLAVRLIPVLAGSLFPVVLSLWLAKVAGKVAAMTALLLLTLAPNLVSVGSQFRSYTLAFLFLAASLLVLEEALLRDRWQWMAVYGVLLCLCVSSDYSTAWFVGGAGVYCLLRLKGSSGAARTAWLAGQLAAAALYGLLYELQVRNLQDSVGQHARSTWLRGAFPRPGTMLTFPFVNTPKPFAYLMSSLPGGTVALALFAIALFWLWTGRTGVPRVKARPLVALLVVPFLLNLAAAYAGLFPYGRSRHTLAIGLFCACGVAVLVQTIPRRAALALLWGALVLTPLWHARAEPDLQNIEAGRSRKALIFECLDYMRGAIPPHSRIFTERATLHVLAWYKSHHQVPLSPTAPGFSESSLGPWTVATRDYDYTTRAAYEDGLQAFRRRFGLAQDEPVWVLDGGWDVVAGSPDPSHPFTKAVGVFQTAPR